MKWKGIVCHVLLTQLGAALVILGIVVHLLGEDKIRDKIAKEVLLKNGSQAFNSWKNPPAQVFMQIYFFDLQNAAEVVNDGAKPIVVEKGPYTYREIRSKVDISFQNDGREILYRNSKAYVFLPELSAGLENDTFTTVNLPMLKVASTFQYWNAFVQSTVNMALSWFEEHLFITLEVGEFLWGYEIKALSQLNSYLPMAVSENKWGFFYGPTGNGSVGEEYVISTGVDNVEDINIINTWRGNSTVEYWSSEYANFINGTDGSMWHPNIDKSERLYAFSPDICRSIYATYEHDNNVKDINLYHFSPPEDLFGIKPENKAFCEPHCIGTGILNVTKCKDAPVIMSQPHFYQGSEKFINAIEGMKPSINHKTYIEVEPWTGIVMNVSKKVQINAHIQAMSSFSETENIEFMIYPILWLDENAVIDANSASKFRSKVLQVVELLWWIKYALLAAGSVVLVISLIVFIFFKCRQKIYKMDVNFKCEGCSKKFKRQSQLGKHHKDCKIFQAQRVVKYNGETLTFLPETETGEVGSPGESDPLRHGDEISSVRSDEHSPCLEVENEICPSKSQECNPSSEERDDNYASKEHNPKPEMEDGIYTPISRENSPQPQPEIEDRIDTPPSKEHNPKQEEGEDIKTSLFMNSISDIKI